MKSFYLPLLAILFFSNQSWSQDNEAGKLNNLGRINLNIFIPADSLLIDETLRHGEYNFMKKTLTNKLRSYVARNGFSGMNRSPRFMLFPTLILHEREYTPTAPTMIIQKMELSLYIADYHDQKTFAVETIDIQGVGKTREKAIRDAFKNINYSPTLQNFLNNGKQRILTYYNDQCDFIKKEVEMLAETHRYETAFKILLQIPQASKECYDEAMKMIPDYYKQLDKRRCYQNLQKATVAWASKSRSFVLIRRQGAQFTFQKDDIADNFNSEHETPKNAGVESSLDANETRKNIYEAFIYLNEILPDSECYEEASKLLDEIKAYVQDEEFYETRKKYEDRQQLEKLKFEIANKLADSSLKEDFDDTRDQKNAAISNILNH